MVRERASTLKQYDEVFALTSFCVRFTVGLLRRSHNESLHRVRPTYQIKCPIHVAPATGAT